MQIVRYGPLKQKLRDRSLTDREALPYLVLFCAITALITSFPFFGGFNRWDTISGASIVVLAVGGVFYVYGKNRGDRGYDFIQKYVTLGWVLGIRFLLVIVPFGIFVYGIADYYFDVFTDATGPLDVALVLVTEILFYQRLGCHIEETATKVSEPVTEGGLE